MKKEQIPLMSMEANPSLTLVTSQITSEICEECGKEIRENVVCAIGVKMRFKQMCPCKKTRLAKIDEEMEQRRKREKLERLFHQSRLGERFKEAAFEKFRTSEDSIAIYNMMKDYAYNFKKCYKANSIILYSKPGTGKTLLASSVVNHLVRNGISAIFVVVPDLLMQIRSSYSRGEITEEKIMEGLLECDLLVLDDVGTEWHKNKDDWASEKLYQIINSRYNNKKAIIFTTNNNIDELFAKLSWRTFSRIVEMTDGFKIDMDKLEDWRMKNCV